MKKLFYFFFLLALIPSALAASDNLTTNFGMYACVFALILIAALLEKEHILAKILFTLFALVLMIITTSSLMSVQTCSFVVANITTNDYYAPNMTLQRYQYTEECVVQTNNPSRFYTAYLWLVRLTFIYILVYLTWLAYQKYLAKVLKRSRK